MMNVVLLEPEMPSNTGKLCGKTLMIKNIDPTIVKGIDAIPAAMTPRTIRNCEIFPIGPIK